MSESEPAVTIAFDDVYTYAGGQRWDLLGIAIFLVLVFPVYWMISTAFKPDSGIISVKPTWPRPFGPQLTASSVQRPISW